MSGFSVHPESLEHVADLLDAMQAGGLHRAYLIDADEYIDKWVRLEGGGGGMIFKSIVEATTTVHDELLVQNFIIQERLGEAGDGLRNSARVYRDQEQRTRTRIDAIYKTGAVTPLDVDAVGAPPDPRVKLTAPSEDGLVVPDIVQQILDGSGWLSETGLVLKIISALGFDAREWVTEKFFGDFAAIAKVMNAVENLAEFDDSAAVVIADGVTELGKGWQGNAADAARNYFDQFSNGINARGTRLHDLRTQYDLVLVAIQQAAAAVENAISLVIDAAVEAAASVAAAGCLEEVPVVDVVADVVAGYKAYKVIKAIREVYTLWTKIWTPHEGVLALIGGLVGGLKSYDVSATLPTRGYYNAAQGPAPKPPSDVMPRPGVPS